MTIRVLFAQDHVTRPSEGIHGVTRYFANTLPAFDPKEVAARLCVLTGRRSAEAEATLNQVDRVYFERGKWDLRTALDLYREIDRFRPDLLHLSAFKSLLVGRSLAERRGIPTIVHIHDANPLSAFLQPVNRLLAAKTSAVIAVSEAVADFAPNHYGFAPSQIRVVHDGLPLGVFQHDFAARRARTRTELALFDSNLAIAVVGRLAPGKGQEYFLQALARAPSTVGQVKAFIIGDGPERSNLVEKTRAAGLEESVTFLGYQSDIPDLLCGMDMAIVPSMIVEGLGYAAIEAMAAGLPVIAHRIGGLTDIIQSEQNGILVEPGDVDGLAKAMVRLVEKPELRLALGNEAQKRANDFGVEHHIEVLMEIYQEVLSKAGKSAHAR